MSDTIIKYSSYTDSQKRATKKYRENNKDKVNEQRKKYYYDRKAKDPSFMLMKRNKAKEYYYKKKSKKVDEPKEEVKLEAKEDGEEVKEEVKEEPKPEVITMTLVDVPTNEDLTASEDESKKPKPKRTYKPRAKKNKSFIVENPKDNSDCDDITLGSSDTYTSSEASTASDKAFIEIDDAYKQVLEKENNIIKKRKYNKKK